MYRQSDFPDAYVRVLKDGHLTKLNVEQQVPALASPSAPLADDLPRGVLAPMQVHTSSVEWAPDVLDKYPARAPTGATVHGDENSRPTAEAPHTDEERRVQTLLGNGQKRTRTNSASGRLPPKKRGRGEREQREREQRERERSEWERSEQKITQVPVEGSPEDEKSKTWTVDDTTRLLEAILGPDSERMYHLVQVNPKKAFSEVCTPFHSDDSSAA